MKTSSAKAKGRLGQDIVREAIRKVGSIFGLEPDDCKSAVMGTSGVDIIFSPAARKVFPWSVEVKVVEALNVMSEFTSHHKQYSHLPTIKLLFHKKNRTPMLTTLLMEDFLNIYTDALHYRRLASPEG